MLKNYFLVALRNLTKYRFFSSINIFGLAISMSVCLGIIMLVADQLQYDRHNANRDRIFRVNTQYLNANGTPAGNDYATTPLPVATSLKEDFTGIDKAVRIRRGFGNGWIEFDQDISIPLAGFFVDPEMMDVFGYELEYGDRRTALSAPFSVVLTRKAANKLFKQENPVGEVIRVGKLGEYTVTGVIKDDRTKSHIVFEALASFSTVPTLEADSTFSKADTNWQNFTSGWVYLMVKDDVNPVQIQQHLNSLAKLHKPSPGLSGEERKYGFNLQNLCAITPGPFINNAIGPFMPRVFVYFFGGLALIVMVTSCFNYTNLSIARSLSRAKEIGVRKVTGANRLQIFSQFMVEAVLLSLVSLGFALVLLIVVKPFLLNLKFAQVLKWDLEANYIVYGSFLVFSIVTGLMAGFFPAIILSRFEPIRVLKKLNSVRLFSRLNLRKALLVFQFSLSLIFIISVLVLYNQLKLFIHADHGFDMAEKIVIRLNNTSVDNLKTELTAYPNIVSTSAASHLPAAGMTLGEGFKRNPHEKELVGVDYYSVDENYLESLSIDLVAGRNFQPTAGAANKGFIIINEQAAKALAFGSSFDALGQYIYSEDSLKYEIIGIVKDYNHQILFTKIAPMALMFNPSRYSILQVKYSGDYENAAAVVETAWTKVNPNQKIDYRDFEEEVRGFYKTVFSDFVNIIGVISFMAIVISCLGLLGMATYSIETRMKEISIRKVLGSTNQQLIFLLSRGFLLLLVIAVVIAIPAAWAINNLWLELIAYRTSISVGVIGSAVAILFIMGALTIGSQTLRAAFANPTQSLKNE
jgi:putative ABC transport system permease protein